MGHLGAGPRHKNKEESQCYNQSKHVGRERAEKLGQMYNFVGHSKDFRFSFIFKKETHQFFYKERDINLHLCVQVIPLPTEYRIG